MERIQIQLPKHMIQSLVTLSRKTGLSLSSLGRAAINSMIKELKTSGQLEE